MSRDIPSGLATAVDAPVVRPFIAVRIELPDPVYVFSGRGTISFPDSDSVTRNWLGVGEFGAIDTVGEATDGSAVGIKVTLLQVPAEFRDDVADQAVRGVKFEVYVGALNETYQTVDAVVLLQKLRLSEYKIIDAGSTLQVEVSGESRAIDQRRPSIKRFSDEYQQSRFPGDKFFEYVSRMTEVSILWAQAEQGSIGTGGGYSGGAGGDGQGYQLPMPNRV